MDTRNKFYNELVKILQSNSLSDALGWMAIHSQSVILNYGEDNCLWECSWIVPRGERFTRVERTPLEAVKSVLNDVRTDFLTNVSPQQVVQAA